jgi:hypothetical protein
MIKISTEEMNTRTKKLTERTAKSCGILCDRNCGATYNDEVSANTDIHQMG